MIRSFNDKLKAKQLVYDAKQVVLEENARRKQVQAEWDAIEQEQVVEQQRIGQILIKEQERKELKFLKEQRIRDKQIHQNTKALNAMHADETAKYNLSKKIISEGHIADVDRYIARSDQQPEEREAPGINDGMPMNSDSTWQLTWKSFSQHPSIVSLPLSEKVRLYKLAESQVVDRLNYYATFDSDQNSLGSGKETDD